MYLTIGNVIALSDLPLKEFRINPVLHLDIFLAYY